MIRLDLTPEQARAVRRGSDSVDLSIEQAEGVRGRLNAYSREYRLSCDCGQPGCKTCTAREYQRARRAAAKRADRSRESAGRSKRTTGGRRAS